MPLFIFCPVLSPILSKQFLDPPTLGGGPVCRLSHVRSSVRSFRKIR